ncbi:MAG: hypothetical protein HQ541_07600 [Mariniphaga sp.]|nr:hypothetical protein [Mariniphaga sp.]
MIIVAGTPGSGKTSVLLNILPHLTWMKVKVAIVKIDCLYSDDHLRFEKAGAPTLLGLSRDMCPDHFTIYNTGAMIEFALGHAVDTLIVETAGLCHRCAPYTVNSLGLCVIDATTGPNTPRKVGPFLSTADIVAITKGDVISQAEREIFRECILEMNPGCMVVEANGLSGKGSGELANYIAQAKNMDIKEEMLRHNAPFSICTLCVGEKHVSKDYHKGIVRHLSGMQTYIGE